jgi:hypothetical protein
VATASRPLVGHAAVSGRAPMTTDTESAEANAAVTAPVAAAGLSMRRIAPSPARLAPRTSSSRPESVNVASLK